MRRNLLIRIPLAALFCLFLAAVAINIWMVETTKDRVFYSIDDIPDNYEIGLVLGTSNKLKNGLANPYFETRIQTALELYRKKKVRRLIVSGDNRSVFYNEPLTMKKALMKFNVPESQILLDNGGIRTIESIIRLKDFFGYRKAIIVTQEFHSYRAIFVCKIRGIDAVILVAPLSEAAESNKVNFREWIARVKAFLEIYFFKKPLFQNNNVYLR